MRPEAGRLLLIGGGRPHLTVLEAVARGRIAPAAVTLVSPHPQCPYSPMVPGYVAGRYTIEELTIDLPAVMRSIGGQFREGAVCRLDAATRTATLEDGATLPWDVASVAIAGACGTAGVPGVREHARLVKPLSRVPELRDALDSAARMAGPEPLQIVVVGAGVTGFELALAVRARLDQMGATRAIILLVDSSHMPLRGHPHRTRTAAELALRKAEITLRLSTAVEEVGANHVRLTGGRVIPIDLVIWTIGMGAPQLFHSSGLPTDAYGCLLVDDRLGVPGCPGLFGAGAAVSLQSDPRASNSRVSSLRQTPVLARNLGLAVAGAADGPGKSGIRPGSTYTPPLRSLELLDLSNGSAILSYGGLVTTAPWAMRLKNRIDRRFVRRFQAPRALQ